MNIRFALLAMLASASVAEAGWFADDGSYNRRREEKVAVLSPQRTTELRKLIAERDARRAEVAVLSRLSAEKAEAVSRIDGRFAGEYGIRPDRNYTYDEASLTVYLLSSDPRHGGSAESPARLPHRVFPEEAEAAEFRALMAAKDAALAAKRVFDATLVEKEAAMRDVLGRMQAGYSLDATKSYRLDPDTRSVWVELPPPEEPPELTPEEKAARKAAAAEAEKKAREEARERSRKLREEAKRLAAEKSRLSDEEAEAERLRQEALRRVEKELAELDAKEAARAKAEAEAKAKAEREAAEAKAKAEREAKEKARIAAKEKAEAEKRAAADAEAKARAEAVAAEEKALADAVSKATATEVAAVNQAKAAVAGAERRLELATARFEEIRRLHDEARSNGGSRTPASDRLAAEKENAFARRNEAERAVRDARRALESAEDSLSRAEKDAKKAFYESMRASGKEPLTEPRGFFSWF